MILSAAKMPIRLRSYVAGHRFIFFALLISALVVLHFHLPSVKIARQRPLSADVVPQIDKAHPSSSDDICGTSSRLGRMVITVKTGATEASKKIPTQLRTSLRCAPHVFVFSDMEEDIGNTHVFDALETIPDYLKDGNPDFDIYRKQKELHDSAKITALLKDMKDPRRPDDLAAWTLDKYKNLHIVERSWKMLPEMDWYLYIDADSYVIMSTLIAWLEKLDPAKKSFMGSLNYIVGKSFAHGGSGILLSRAAMHSFVVTHNGTAARWDPDLHDNCCGDWVLAQAVKEYGMEVMQAHPTINGDEPPAIPFSSGRWCQPFATMHHISPDEALKLADFEDRRQDKLVCHMVFALKYFTR